MDTRVDAASSLQCQMVQEHGYSQPSGKISAIKTSSNKFKLFDRFNVLCKDDIDKGWTTAALVACQLLRNPVDIGKNFYLTGHYLKNFV